LCWVVIKIILKKNNKKIFLNKKHFKTIYVFSTPARQTRIKEKKRKKKKDSLSKLRHTKIQLQIKFKLRPIDIQVQYGLLVFE